LEQTGIDVPDILRAHQNLETDVKKSKKREPKNEYSFDILRKYVYFYNKRSYDWYKRETSLGKDKVNMLPEEKGN
jgi:hypothetical protein